MVAVLVVLDGLPGVVVAVVDDPAARFGCECVRSVGLATVTVPVWREAGAGAAGDASVRRGEEVEGCGGRRTDPPQRVVWSAPLASEWCSNSSHPVSATLPMTKAAIVVRTTRSQRAGLRRSRAT